MADQILVDVSDPAGDLILVDIQETGSPGPPGPIDTTYSDEFKEPKVHGRKFDHRLRNYEVGKVNAKKNTGNLVTMSFYDSIGVLGSMDEFHTNIFRRYGGQISNNAYPFGWMQMGGGFAFYGYAPNRITVNNAVFNSTTTITSATANFTTTDKYRFVTGTGIPAGAYIVNVNSSISITISAATTTSGSGKTLTVGGPGQGDGIDGFATVMNSGEYMTRTLIANSQTCRIFFDGAGPGTFRASVAGVDIGVSVDITSGTYVHGTMKYYDVTVAAFFQDFRITCTSGTVRILGTYFFSDLPTEGGEAQHWQLAHSGTKTADWNSYDKFQDFVEWLKPNAIYTDMFINDDADGVTAYGTNITTMVNDLRSSSPNSDIIWIGTHGTFNHTNAAALHTKLKERAYNLDFIHIDLYEAMGDYTTADANGLVSADHVHLTPLGRAVLSDIVTGVMEGMENLSTNYLKTDGSNSISQINFGSDDTLPSKALARLQFTSFNGWNYALLTDPLGVVGAHPIYIGDPTVASTSIGGQAGQFAARLFEVLQNRTTFVRTITTANITLSGLQTLNGYTTVAGDAVLVKNQTTGSQNGIYVAATGAWARHPDFDSNWTTTFYKGKKVLVISGNAAGQSWYLSNTGIVTVGTTTQTWAQTMSLSKGGMYKSTYYTKPDYVTQGTSAFTLGNLLVVPLFLSVPRVIAAIGCDMTVASTTGGMVRFSCYSNSVSGDFPSGVVWNGAQIPTDVATGWIEDTAVSGTVCPAGWNYFGLVNQVAAATWRSITQLTQPLPESSPSGASTPSAWLTTGVTSAAGPSPWSSTSQGASAPLIKVKFA